MTRPVQLFRGDCLDLLPSIPDGSVDMICADLPYGTTNCHWDNRIPMEPLWREFWRVAKHNAAVCLFAQQPFATDLINAARKWFRYEWVVVKNRALGLLNANKMPLRAHELVLVFYRALPPYTPQKTGEGKPRVIVRKANPSQIYGSTHGTTTWSDGRRFPRDVLMARAINKPTHPTEKPVEVLEILIKSYTNRGGGDNCALVLDPTMGSGTCGVACVHTGRRFIGMEKDAHFFEVAQRRIAEAKVEVE